MFWVIIPMIWKKADPTADPALVTYLERSPLVLHLGAHKTATTFLQDTLRHHETALAADGVRLVLPRQTRRVLSLVSPNPGKDRPAREDALSSNRAKLGKALSALASEPETKRIVMSEEGLIGAPRQIVTDAKLYPDIETRLQSLPEALNHPNVTILFAVRDYGQFFSSCFTTVLRRGARFDPASVAARLLRADPNWQDVLRAIRARLPRAALRIWQYERFGDRQADVVASLAAQNIAPPKPSVFRTLSHAAVDALLSEPRQDLTRPELRKRVRRIARQFPVGETNPAFSLWTPEQSAAWAATYAAHWQQIEQAWAADLF